MLSFVGSAPPGIINMTVAELSLRRSFRIGMIVALGASLVELIQSWIALQFTWLFTGTSLVSELIRWSSVPILIGLGLYYWFQKPGEEQAESQTGREGYFLRGMLVSALNLLAFPYWAFYGTWLQSNQWLMKDHLHILVFCIGVCTGTFVLLLLYGKLSARMLGGRKRVAALANKVIGATLTGFGLYQLIKILISI